jgi:drug/metabolite transporter (DMT)-like permease
MVLVWSASFIFAKMALADIPGLLMACVRTSVAAVLILPLHWWNERRAPAPATPRELLFLFGLGFGGIVLNQLLFVVGLSRTSVAHAAFLVALAPILVLLLAAVRGQERLTPRKVFGLAVAAGGVCLLQLLPGASREASLSGDAIILVATIALAIYTVAGREIAHRHGAIRINTYAYAGGALLLSPVLFWQARGFNFGAVRSGAWVGLLYMAVFSSIVAHVIYYWALSHLPASRVASFSYLQPLVATVLAIPALGEPLTTPVMAGGALVLAGVWLTERG